MGEQGRPLGAPPIPQHFPFFFSAHGPFFLFCARCFSGRPGGGAFYKEAGCARRGLHTLFAPPPFGAPNCDPKMMPCKPPFLRPVLLFAVDGNPLRAQMLPFSRAARGYWSAAHDAAAAAVGEAAAAVGVAAVPSGSDGAAATPLSLCLFPLRPLPLFLVPLRRSARAARVQRATLALGARVSESEDDHHHTTLFSAAARLPFAVKPRKASQHALRRVKTGPCRQIDVGDLGGGGGGGRSACWQRVLRARAARVLADCACAARLHPLRPPPPSASAGSVNVQSSVWRCSLTEGCSGGVRGNSAVLSRDAGGDARRAAEAGSARAAQQQQQRLVPKRAP